MSEDQRSEHRVWIEAALAEARDGVASGGMPFGAVLVIGGQIVARGHNRQIQDRRFLAHAEMVCLESFLAGHDGPLENATLHFGPSLGISNELRVAEAEVKVSAGILLVIHGRRRPQPAPSAAPTAEPAASATGAPEPSTAKTNGGG